MSDDPQHDEFVRRVFDLMREVYGVDGQILPGNVDIQYSLEGIDISEQPPQYEGCRKWAQELDEVVRWRVTLRFDTVKTVIVVLKGGGP